jgi:AbrB family looped-hinge helix DNA binding protein
MLVTEKGQVTIPKPIREAAGVRPGTEVQFALEGGRIVITPVSSPIKDDRREALRRAAARARATMLPEFRRMSADEIMEFIRGEGPVPTPAARKRPPRVRR